LAVERVREIRGTGLPVRGDDIDTDRIIPARFLKSISFEGLEDHLFEDDRQQLATHPVSNPAYRSASVMLVNANFGCGSSREHAPQAIRRRGIRAVVGQSFSEIFFGNSVVMGLPCPTASPETVSALMAAVERDPSTEIVVDLAAMRVTAAGKSYELSLPAAAREAFLDGSWDATGLLLENYDDVRAVAARLPYVSGEWSAHSGDTY
jgi:3-isopropylmalate/(R)-2-methylmalate dehydratase small subunit